MEQLKDEKFIHTETFRHEYISNKKQRAYLITQKITNKGIKTHYTEKT